jgi:glutathione S-transferase
LERRLGEQEFLAGSYSYADIAFYMAQVFGVRMGAPLDESTPHLLAWRERVGARPAVRKVVGAMVAFLVSQGRPIPPFLASLMPGPPKPS